jgi:uncharacterized protein
VSEKPRIVIDTQVLLRATVNRRSLPAKLVFDLRNRYRRFTSFMMWEEFYDVLHRPKVRQKFKLLTDSVVKETLALLSDVEWVIPDETPAISRDPKDDMVLATAISSHAGFIVSEDKDLLVLHPYEGVQIVNVLDIVRTLEPKDD